MRSSIVGLVFLLATSTQVHGRVVKWEGRPISVSISMERITRIEFPEALRSAFLGRSDISIEKEERSLYLRAILPDTQDTLFVVGESGTTYEIALSTSDKPDTTVLISFTPKSLELQAERARQVPALDLMRSMMLGLPVQGYETMSGENREVYGDAFFSMKLMKIYRSPVLHGYVIEVENVASFPVLLRVQEIDFTGMVAVSADSEYLQPKPRKASDLARGEFRTHLYLVALPAQGLY